MQTRSGRVNPRFLDPENIVEELEQAAEDRLANKIAGNFRIFYSMTYFIEATREAPLSTRKTRYGKLLGKRDSLEEALQQADEQSSQSSDTLSGVWGVQASQLKLDTQNSQTQESQTQLSQLSQYELMERAAEGSLSQQIVAGDNSQASKSSSQGSSQYKTPTNSQKSTQYRTPEGSPQNSPGPTQYMTPEIPMPEILSPKTPSVSSQAAHETPPLPGKKTKRTLFVDGNKEEDLESPDVIVASRTESTTQAVTTKDSSTQDSGETLVETNKLESRDMEAQTTASLVNEPTQISTQDLEKLLTHTQLDFDTQESQDSDYATPPSSPTRNTQITSSQRTFDESLDDDYFQKLRSPRSDMGESTDNFHEIRRAGGVEVIKEDVKFIADVSSARAANMQMFIERSKTCTENEDHIRYQIIRNLFSTEHEELREIASWEPVIPELEDDEPSKSKKAPLKVSRAVLPPPSPKKKAKKSSPKKRSGQSQSQQMGQAVENWSQEVQPGNIEESQSSQARPNVTENTQRWLESQQDQPVQDPSQQPAINQRPRRPRVSEFLFPSSKSPSKNKRKRSKSPDKSEENTSKRAALNQATVLKPSEDIAVHRRPGRDALSDITDLSSAFDNDSPIRVRQVKTKQPKRAPVSLERNEKSHEPKRASLRNEKDQPTCSKYFLPESTQMREISAMLSESESENDSSDEEKRRAPTSLPRERRKEAEKLPKMTKLKSPTKSRAISKQRKKSKSRNEVLKQDIVVRKPLRSLNSSVDTRDPREVLEEVSISIKDVRNCQGKIGLTFDTEKPSHIYVKEVKPGSPADVNGFKPGDIIVSFNRTRCSYKSRVTLSVFLCLFTESEEADFDFVVVRDLPDTFSAGEASDADTSEVSDISDLAELSNLNSKDSGNDLNIS